MKKIFALSLAVLMALALAACGGNNTTTSEAASTPADDTSIAGEASTPADDVDPDAKDGVYTAMVTEEYAEENGHGYRDQLTVTYENGVIVSAEYDSIRLEDGVAKSTLDEDGYPNMNDEEGNPFPPTVWIPMINEQIVNDGKVDGIAAATGSSTTAQALLEAIEAEGVAGGTIEVDPSAE